MNVVAARYYSCRSAAPSRVVTVTIAGGGGGGVVTAVILVGATAAAAASLAAIVNDDVHPGSSSSSSSDDSTTRDQWCQHTASLRFSKCEGQPNLSNESRSRRDQSISTRMGAAPSSWRQALYAWHLWPYYYLPAPLPRRLVGHDPVWTLSARQIQQRARDELQQREILEKIISVVHNNTPPNTVTTSSNMSGRDEWTCRQQQQQAWQKEWLDTVYGPGVTLKDRQDFLERYGCTGWTDKVIDALMKLGSSSSNCGFVEIGAGNGQWARVLTDRYKQQQQLPESARAKNKKQFDFVLAYDNASRLPLNPEIYHSQTRPAHEHFYDKVQPLHANSVEATVKQWQCRGRVLLLVYPPPDSDMAVEAVRSYDQVNGHTIVYVGEGRGGANANDAFFDYLEDHYDNENHSWILDRVMEGKSFGTKGYEKVYVLKKCAR
jgi:hypothetical protein